MRSPGDYLLRDFCATTALSGQRGQLQEVVDALHVDAVEVTSPFPTPVGTADPKAFVVR